MKQARIRSYKPLRRSSRQRNLRHTRFHLLLKVTPYFLALLPFMVVVILFSLPKTPHILWSYTYTGLRTHPRYLSCQYFGIHGLSQTRASPNCPLLDFIGK